MDEYIPRLLTIEDLIKSCIYKIPVYQRPYSWGIEQINDMKSDLLSSFLSQQNLFAGTIYVKSTTRNFGCIREYEIIDGQQRITTFTLFLLCMHGMLSDLEIIGHSHTFQIIRNLLWKEDSFVKNGYINLIESGSIENSLLLRIFDVAFTNERDFVKGIYYFFPENDIENQLLISLRAIHRFLKDSILNKLGPVQFEAFCGFFLNRVTLISIEVQTTHKKVFSMFEAINSKGKQLEEIDLIKTFIFSELFEEDYSEYLIKWGTLIKETNNDLENYLWAYIKAFVRYYKNAIKAKIFKNFAQDATVWRQFRATNKRDFLKKLIDDLLNKVKCYAALFDVQKFKKIVELPHILFQHNIFVTLKYQHPIPVLLRALYEYCSSTDQINGSENLYKIFQYLNSFMILFQTLNNRDSKDSIPLISMICNSHYNVSTLNSRTIHSIVKSRLLMERISTLNFTEKLKHVAGFNESETDIGFVMLVINEIINKDSDNIPYNLGNYIFEAKSQLCLEHILPLDPDKWSHYTYYSRKNQIGENVLVLKNNHDFPSSVAQNMSYDSFTEVILNKLGNLYLKHRNPMSVSKSIPLATIEDIFTYNSISIRMNSIIQNVIASKVLFIPDDDGEIILPPPPQTPTSTNKNDDSYDEDIFILEFGNLDQATGKKPHSITIFKEKYNVSENYKLSFTLFNLLYTRSPEMFCGYISNKCYNDNSRNPFISTNETDIRRPIRIPNSPYYIEKNMSTVDILKSIRKVWFELYQYDDNDILIKYYI